MARFLIHACCIDADSRLAGDDANGIVILKRCLCHPPNETGPPDKRTIYHMEIDRYSLHVGDVLI